MNDLRLLFSKVEDLKIRVRDHGQIYSVEYADGFTDALNWVLDLVEDIETGAAA